LEHEVLGETVVVAFDSPVERAGINPVELGQVEIQDDFFVPNLICP